MVEFRDGGTLHLNTQGSLIPSQVQVASRSSWFVPLVGLCVYIYAIVDSSIEGCNLPLFFDSLIGLALISYRLWPSLAAKRVSILVLLFLAELLFLVAQVLTFVIDSPVLQDWIGYKSIAGLVLNSLTLVTLGVLAWDKIPSALHNPSGIPFWRIPLGFQLVWYVLGLAGAVTFNPSIFVFPYLGILLWSLSQLGAGVTLEQNVLGSKRFHRLVLSYTCLYGSIAYILGLPVISTAVVNTGWLARTLGVPSIGDNAYNYSCLMPCGISLLCTILMAPWWADVGIARRFPRADRVPRAQSARMEDTSPHRSRRLASTASSALDSPEDEAIVAEALRAFEEKRKKAEKREQLLKKYLKFFQVFVANILFPLTLIVIPLLLPSTMVIPLVCAGVVFFAAPRMLESEGLSLQLYLTMFVALIYATAVVANGVILSDTATSILTGIGFLARSNMGNVWDRYLVFIEVMGLLLFSVLVNRFHVFVELHNRTASINTHVGRTFMQTMLGTPGLPRPSLATSAINEDLGGGTAYTLVKQGFVGSLRSAEIGYICVISVVFSLAAIEKSTSPVSVLYILLVLPRLWLRSGKSFPSLLLAIGGFSFTCVMVGYASWVSTTSPPQWLGDIGFPAPTPSSCLAASLPHVLIALCGCMHLRLKSYSVSAVSLRVSCFFEKYPVVYSRSGLLVPMVLSLVLFVLMPFDYFSAVVVVWFVVQMALLQEGNGFGTYSIHAVFLRVNVLQQFVLAVTLVWVLTSMIPWINAAVVSALDGNDDIVASELAVLPNAEYLGKLCVVSALLVSGSFLWRHRSFIEKAGEQRPAARPEDWASKHPVTSRIMLVLSSQLARVLLFVIFLASVYQTTLLNVASELVVCVFLIIGYGWTQVGLVFSVFAMLLLFLQYMASLAIVSNFVDPQLLDYLGMYWSWGSVARNIAIFVACIVQKNIEHFVNFRLGTETKDLFFERLDKYAQVIIGLVLVLGATGRGNVFSIIYIIMGSGFIVRQSLTARRMSTWSLRFVAIVVGLCLAWQQLVRLWLPSGCESCPQRPELNSLCPDQSAVNDLYACIDDWQRYLNVPSSASGSTVLVDMDEVRNSIASSLGFETPYTATKLVPNGILWDFFILWTVCVLMKNHSLQPSTVSTGSSADAIRSRRRKAWTALTCVLARYWIVVVELLGILSCFSFRETVDAISIAYMTFLFILGWAQEKPLRTRRRVVVTGIVVGIIVVGVTIGYQIPMFSCKYWTMEPSLLFTGPPPTGPEPSGWSVPTMMCIDMQRSLDGIENFGAITWKQIALQVVGLMKADTRFVATPWPMTIGPPILLLSALLIQLALYDHSKTYARINEIYFDGEFRLRAMRARRFVAEFNSSLFVRNRQVTCALEATRRKLDRVQQSADILLSIFYSRLAGAPTGELQRSQTDHLSSESETVCARGYSPEEAELAVALARDQADGTALLVLEAASEFALNGCQETEVVLRCKSLVQEDQEEDSAGEGSSLRWYQKVGRWFLYVNRKFSNWLSYKIDDVVFVSDVNAAEPLSLHRRNDGTITLLTKALFTNSQIFVVFFSVLAFVATNSVFDVIRVAIVIGSLPVWPFANRNVWRLLLLYTVVGILIKAIYQLPLFCAVGIDGNDSFSAPLWRLTTEAQGNFGYIEPCSKPLIVGWDIVTGMQKMFGSSALSSTSTTSFAGVIWQDALVLVAIFWYRSFLHKAGIWNYLQVASIEKASGAIIVPRPRERASSPQHILSEESAADAAAPDDVGDEDVAQIETGVDDFGGTDDGSESPVGSFVDLDAKPLDVSDRDELSRYAVYRHMGTEDVVGRLIPPAATWSLGVSSIVLSILQIYKRVRWEAQFVYCNHECVRIPREDREAIRTVVTSGLSLLPKISALYVKINPFYAVKVGQDFYVYFFVIGLMMFFHVIVFYSKMAGAGTADFVSSLQRSQFSGGLALLMLFHFVLLIFDRAYYIASFRRSNDESSRKSGSGFRAPPKQQVYWFFLRLVILISLLVTLHAVIMNSLFTATNYSPLIKNAALSIYYLEFMLYLIIAGLQIREGFPRLMKESLRPDKTYHTITDKFQEIRFMVYRAIPFLDELRLLIDWTVSRTCLDLLQFFKLDDAHTYLWQTGRDMEIRKKMWPAEPIGKGEKSFMGFGFLLLLMFLIIGPVLLFSTLVSPGVVAPLSSASLSVSLVVQTCPGCSSWYEGAPVSSSSMQLFSATPSSISTLTQAEEDAFFPNGRADIDQDSSVQRVVFEKQSEVALVVNSERYSSFVASTAQAVYIKIETALTFQRQTESGGYVGPPSTIRMPSCACQRGFESLCRQCSSVLSNQTQLAFDSMFSAANAILAPTDTSLVLVPGSLSQVINIDSLGAIVDTSLQSYPDFKNKSMAIAIIDTAGYVSVWEGTCGLGYAGICPGYDETAANTTGVDPVFSFIMAPILASEGTGGSLLSVGIVTVYITIVYAIGRFLRLVFDKESLRVIYCEIPRPDDLVDLATGAAIARHYKDLPMEFRLYNCLIKIMRSPETLIALGGADLSGFGARRTDQPPHPELLSQEDQERIRRRRRKNYK